MNRIEREKLVVRQMIAIYCHKHHAHNDNILCDDCLDLLNYAHQCIFRRKPPRHSGDNHPVF